ncbi:hypothetical protein [Dermatobacter hominis]|uniref:hypothetical protein n=1 Tax=Dermatobacter hominis TaxID=2884263 RepID=UPI001D10F380|nr:hypothetical protein [Dermatobacter hominis]UDY37589.1 hypothetical protein LH044_08620 [Dermatobacter hominis]
MSSTTATAIAPARRGVWLLPAAAAITLWATFEHQPDVRSQFDDWARFVTTDRFLATHLIGSIVGQALWILGAAALAAISLAAGRRVRSAIAGLVAMTVGGAGLIAGFGVAAFAQPAIGHLELAGVAGAHDVYDDVYGIPTFVTLVGGGVLFAVATVLIARAAAAVDGVPRWAAIAFGAAGPFIGFLGIAVGPLQTVGSLAALAGGVAIALAVHRLNPARDAVGMEPTVGGSTHVPVA